MTEGTVGLVECLNGLQPTLTKAMNGTILAKFTSCEVEAALSQMAPLKSPGPDGFTAVFFQKSWPMVSKEVCEAVLGFLNGGFLSCFK